MYICQIAEGEHTYLLKCWRGTCSSVRLLKRYMVRERLGTPELFLALQGSFGCSLTTQMANTNHV